MKKLLLLSLLVLFSLHSKGEVWFDIGAKGAYAPGVFTNAHLLSSRNQSLKYNHGYFYGGKLGVNFGLTHSMTIDLLLSKTTQTLINSLKTNNYTVSLSSLDLPIMYRHNQDNGGYSEIGPQFTFTQEANLSVNGLTSDIKSNFNSTNMGVAFGFGQYIGGGQAFGFNMGLRFAYMFGDIVASSSQNMGDDPIFQPLGAEEIGKYTYNPTGRLYAGVVLEANFNIGYITKGSRCSKRTRFKMF
ncbi:MAG: hypothetical protein ACJA0Q_000684 [Saprospiraceae bacterium]|jgi:hypothetical protein